MAAVGCRRLDLPMVGYFWLAWSQSSHFATTVIEKSTELHSSRALLTRQRQFPSLVKMLLFCPSCSNVLTVSTTTHGPENDTINRLECQTCPYEFLLQGQYFERKTYVRKEREDVFGGESAWDNADKTKIQCPKDGCDGDEAAFYQVQIRSADEPMTGFYKVSSGSALLAYRTMQRSWADHMGSV